MGYGLNRAIAGVMGYDRSEGRGGGLVGGV